MQDEIKEITKILKLHQELLEKHGDAIESLLKMIKHLRETGTWKVEG